MVILVYIKRRDVDEEHMLRRMLDSLYQERDGYEYRTPGRKTRVNYVKWGVKKGGRSRRATWKNDIQNQSGNSRWWEKAREEGTWHYVYTLYSVF